MWQYLTVHHTNIFRDTGAVFLVLVRALLLGTMIWLTYKDIVMKGVQYKFFTVWGAYSTLLCFFCLLVVSLQKMWEQEQFRKADQRRELVEDMTNQRNFWYFNSFTAWLFQWSLISELTIAFCFWVWLWVFGTDVSKLSSE